MEKKEKNRRLSFDMLLPTAFEIDRYVYHKRRGEKCPPLFTKEQNELIDSVLKKLKKIEKRQEEYLAKAKK